MKPWALVLALAVFASASSAHALIEAGDVKLPPWVRTPGVNGYYPERAVRRAVSGLAIIHCQVDGHGKLNQCTAPGEEPKDYGFAVASQDMAPRLAIDLARAPVKDGAVDIPVSFFGRHVGAVTSPTWVVRPDADDVGAAWRAVIKDGAAGTASVRCEASWAGRLEQCVVVRQSASGFGDAALRLTPLFKMALLDGEGSPVIGREIVVPFQFGTE